MAMVVFGNAVTAFSWFGVNLLGIGLHSYGFMDGAFFWLITFVVSQVVVIAFALLPLKYWKSFKGLPQSPEPSNPQGKAPEAISA